MNPGSSKSRKVAAVFLITLAIITASAAITFKLVPWNASAVRQLKLFLEAQGFQNVRLTFSAIGWHSAALRDVKIGDDDPLTVHDAKVSWSPSELKYGVLDELAMSGLTLRIRQEAGSWRIEGYNHRAATQKPRSLPVSRTDLQILPFDHVKIEDGQITIAANAWQAVVPIQFDLQKSGPTFILKIRNLRLTSSGLDIVGNADIDCNLDEQERSWNGQWQIANFVVKRGDNSLSPLSGTGTLRAEADKLSLRGELKGADRLTKFSFMLTTSFAAGSGSELDVETASMPWQGGEIALKRAIIPFGSNEPIHLTLLVHHASVDLLMQALTGKHVTATGAVSGNIPLIVAPDGSVTVGAQAALMADGPGTIIMPPDAIPGDNAQIETLREILKDFHYSGLSIAAAKDSTGKKLSLLVALEGNNPAAYNGRQVKLNVHMAGDVLDFIRQNVMFLTDPKSLLQQGQP